MVSKGNMNGKEDVFLFGGRVKMRDEGREKTW